MLALSPGFLRHVFFEEVTASARPVSEPGMALERTLSFFAPGDEERLRAFWDDTQSMRDWLLQHAPQTLEGHLRNLQVRFLDADPSSWGPVELARMHSVAASTKWILENASLRLQEAKRARPEDAAALDHILEILSPHCAGAGFHLNTPAQTALDAARTRLHDANARWMEQERLQRSEAAAQLGVEPARLKSDITLPAGAPEIEAFRAHPNMQEVETAVHYTRFRFTVTGGARAALETLLQARRECTEQENTEMIALQNRLAPLVAPLKHALTAAGWVDIHFGRARWAAACEACRPEIAQNGIIEAQEASHPHIERQVQQMGRPYQRLSFCLKPPVTSLTGANMGGKTAFLRTVGLFQVLFQKGYFLPARYFSGVLFRSLAWIGAAPDAPQLGLSSFGRECRDLADALAMPEPRFCLVDEFARSTAVEEGVALMGALMDALYASLGHHVFAGHIQNPPCRIASAFHLHTGGLDFDAYQRHLLTLEPEKALAASMNYRIYEGKSGGSDALRIAEALGVPSPIVKDAARILQSLRQAKSN